ncbi:bactericidal permeability-increasing protein [Latimeria chalumnae]|uniref:bactericidal permeability-increasing protein n=1 Tax=Latimeria chalumnae TaxID=7897 RepID=UPI00313BF4F0
MRTATLILALFTVFVVTAWANNPGLVARITDKGIDYARVKGIQSLQKALTKIKIPDFTGKFRIKHFLKVHYSFYNIIIRNFQLPSSSITLVPGTGLKVSIQNAFIELNGQWRVKMKIMRTHGSFRVNVKGLSASVGLKLGADGSGRPTVSTFSCSSHISAVKVHISGRLSWLYKIFKKSIESRLRKSLENKMCSVIQKSITEKLQPILQTLKVTAKVDKYAGINYSLVSPPTITSVSLDLGLKGEFFDLFHHVKIPFDASALNIPLGQNRMLYFGLSKYFFNSAGFIYHAVGALVKNITDDMIPKESKIRLNTTYFGLLIPQLQKLYPNMLMKMRVLTDSAPFLTISPSNLTLTATGEIQAFAILPNSSLAPLFILHMNTSILAKIGVVDNRITAKVNLDRLQMTLKHSDVGTFSVSVLNIAINFCVSWILLPEVNDLLAKGYPLPVMDHIKLSDITIEPKQNFLLFGANVIYN